MAPMQPPTARRNIPHDTVEFEKFLDKELADAIKTEIVKKPKKGKPPTSNKEKQKNGRWKIVEGDKVFVRFRQDRGKNSEIIKILRVCFKFSAF